MSLKTPSQFILGILFVGMFWASTSRNIQAQNAPQTSFEFNQTDLRQALRQLFRSAQVSYSISPDLQGVVTLSTKNVPFETVLRAVLQQVDANYRIVSGVYEIFPRPARSIRISGPDPFENHLITEQPGDTAITQDCRYLYVVKGWMVFKFNKSDLTLVTKKPLEQEVPTKHSHSRQTK